MKVTTKKDTMENDKAWLITIGLEIHAQIKSQYKLFSNSTNGNKQDDINAIANSQISYFDVGFPGTMPKLNKYCVVQAIKTGLALNGTINQTSYFDRKHYFYPDLPNGFQITQFFQPIVTGGYVELKNGKKIGIHHIHMEADAGQLSHKDNNSLANWNRASVGLMEIVTNPEMESIEETIEFIKKLHLILQYVDSCSGNMEEGNFRVDVNISIRKNQEDPLGQRVEIKNINSFRFIEAAIKYEIERQANIINKGSKVTQETRGFDSNEFTTYSMRDKETAPQYRYMWEPNIPPLVIEDNVIKHIKENLPKLPQEKWNEYKKMALEDNVIEILLENFLLQDFFEKTIELLKEKDLTVQLANWIIGDLYGFSNKLEKDFSKYNPLYLINIISSIKNEKISGKIGKYVLEKSINLNKDPMEIVTEENLWQITDFEVIDKYVIETLQEQSKKHEEYKTTKDDRIINFLVGVVLKKTLGKGSPVICKERLLKHI